MVEKKIVENVLGKAYNGHEADERIRKIIGKGKKNNPRVEYQTI